MSEKLEIVFWGIVDAEQLRYNELNELAAQSPLFRHGVHDRDANGG